MLAATLTNRKLGCEFEFAMPIVGGGSGHDVQRVLADVLTANDLTACSRAYCHDPLPPQCDLAVEYDSSVRGMDDMPGIAWASIELKTRILEGMEDWERIVPKALGICQYLGGRVNVSTGFHVHVDFPEARRRPTKIRSLYNIFHRFEPVLYGLIASSRRTCGFAKPLPNRPRLFHNCRGIRSFQRALSSWERHCGLNLTNLWAQDPHIEFRYHQGTLDAEKARHWLRLLNRLVEHSVVRNCQAASEPVECNRKGFEAMRYTIGLRPNAGIYKSVAPEFKETSRFLLRRWRQFNEPDVSGDDEKARQMFVEVA